MITLFFTFFWNTGFTCEFFFLIVLSFNTIFCSVATQLKKVTDELKAANDYVDIREEHFF